METTVLSPSRKKAKERYEKIWRDFEYYYRPEEKNKMEVIRRIALEQSIDPQSCWRIVQRMAKVKKGEQAKEEASTH